MQQKILVIALPIAVACVWLMLTWEPVSRQADEASAGGPALAEQTETPKPSPAVAAPPVTTPPPSAAPPPSEPQAEVQEPAPAPAPADEPSSMNVQPTPDQPIDPQNLPPPRMSGPIQELQQAFEGAARDSGSAALESTIESAFKIPSVQEGLLDTVVCHGDVCRIRTRWSSQRAGAFMYAITELSTKSADPEGKTPMFARNYGFGQASERNSNGEQTLDVYVRKQSAPTSPKSAD